MRKETVTFVCDICGAPLPQQFVKKNSNGKEYFDVHEYNTVRFGPGRRVRFDITVDIEYAPDQKEFCPTCRIDGLREILSKLVLEHKTKEA